MIIVHGFGAYFGMPDGSPFVMKTMIQLKLAGLEYEHRASGVAKAPRGKVPYIEDDGEIISDSTLIRRHIERKYKVDLDAGLTVEQRAAAWSLEKMAEDHLYFALIDLRWRDDHNFEVGPAHFFDRLPILLRSLVRRIGRARMTKTLYLQGTSRLSRASVEENAGADIDAVAVLLGERQYMMGDEATAVDGFIYGVLANLLVPIFETDLRRRIEIHPNLTAYVERLSQRFFS
ncbi:glutathione S-transferase family protein [Bradyrhizobium sp. 156]|uniref:glutathione S-transferase family protein n=1 Tax=Bradyrhizobium sp. 156 TaxID=2782630 RepID=UPI001FF71EE3|nr:glutathione S-transferase family protein [Bradyrhizobium sp. 156]MCK1323584.1 glutathione S-transferase family protein [Bradyrhizobium sp. 156]